MLRQTDTAELLTPVFKFWDSDEGRPYKGSLFDWSDFDGDENQRPDNLGCMCAQGQVLAIAGGWVPSQFRDVAQSYADKAVADLLNISRAHSVLLRNINDRSDGAPSIVLRDPSKVLGGHWPSLLDFWWMLDQFSDGEWAAAGAAVWDAARGAARDAARDAAWDAARGAAMGAARDAAWDAAMGAAGAAVWDAARDAAWAVSGAVAEIQGFELLGERGRDVFFLPAFGIKTLSDIPARPADYGLGFVPVGCAA